MDSTHLFLMLRMNYGLIFGFLFCSGKTTKYSFTVGGTGTENTALQVYRDGEKRANIFHDGKGYIVDLIENSNLKETREVYAHSIHYAEDVAYNWVSGLIKLWSGSLEDLK